MQPAGPYRNRGGPYRNRLGRFVRVSVYVRECVSVCCAVSCAVCVFVCVVLRVFVCCVFLCVVVLLPLSVWLSQCVMHRTGPYRNPVAVAVGPFPVAVTLAYD